MIFSKYAVSASVIGILAGVLILLKSYFAGGRYDGDERMTGKTVIITGANSGIGKETARLLARRGARVIMACRNLDKCEKARQEIVLDTLSQSIECKRLDLSSFASIRAFARNINETEPHVDVLINNAAMIFGPHMLTEDGLEVQIGVNHFGHFLLTKLLLDKLKTSAPSRIINVASKAHAWGEINLDDLNSTKGYNRFTAYAQSKLANIIHANELARRLKGTGVTANSLHPGFVDTVPLENVTASFFNFFYLVVYPLKLITTKTTFEGAQTTLRLTIDSSLQKVSGKYFSDCEEKDPLPLALDETVAKKLWDLSEAWTKSTTE